MHLQSIVRGVPRLAGWLGMSITMMIMLIPVALFAWWWIWTSDPHISACQAARQEMLLHGLDYKVHPEDEYRYPEVYAQDLQHQQHALAQFSENNCQGSIYRLDQSG
jgi:hypothetical protein